MLTRQLSALNYLVFANSAVFLFVSFVDFLKPINLLSKDDVSLKLLVVTGGHDKIGSHLVD